MNAIASTLIERLAQAGLQAEIVKTIQYGVKLTIEHQYVCALYSGKKGQSLVFEGQWPEKLKNQVERLWEGKAVSPKPATIHHTQTMAEPRTCDATVIYVDGSFRQNLVGWAFEAWKGHSPIASQSGVLDDPLYLEHHNVSGECYAVLQALQWAGANGHRHIEIRHDYAGLKAWATGEWQAKPRFTQGYQQAVQALSQQISIYWTKIPAHSGERGNERVDRLAAEAIDRILSATQPREERF